MYLDLRMYRCLNKLKYWGKYTFFVLCIPHLVPGLYELKTFCSDLSFLKMEFVKLQIRSFKDLFKTRRNPESFSSFKLCPFFTVFCKLAVRSASIQSTTTGKNQVPALHFSSFTQFHSEVHHSINEKICCYAHFNWDFKLEHEKKVIVKKSYILKNVSGPWSWKSAGWVLRPIAWKHNSQE